MNKFYRQLSKAFTRTTDILSGLGPSPAKQFKKAIIEGDEEKAIHLYTATSSDEGDKKQTTSLLLELHPSKPFPTSKKVSSGDTPMHLAVKFALIKLAMMLLENGGDPSVINNRKETVLHSLCSLPTSAEVRREILDLIIEWCSSLQRGIDGTASSLSVNYVDIDGNTAIHNAAANNLLKCVERLVQLGAIISIVNKINQTCCDVADINQHPNLATMLELALVFQPLDIGLESYNSTQSFPYDGQASKLYLDCHCLTTSLFNDFIEESIELIANYLHETRARAEVLLSMNNWNAVKLIEDVKLNAEQVYTSAKIDFAYKKTPEIKEIDQEIIQNKLISPGIPATIFDTDVIDVKFEDAAENSKELTNQQAVSNGKCCPICMENLLPSLDIKELISKPWEDSNDQRELICGSGHGFCLNCWSSHVKVQVVENGIGCLPCASYKCGEILDVAWAPILLQEQELVNRFMNLRQRSAIDRCQIKCCPKTDCNLFMYIASRNNEVSEHTVSQSIICSNGHGTCLSCDLDAHSPCNCSVLKNWLEQVHLHLKEADINSEGQDAETSSKGISGDEIANAFWLSANTKRCPRCSTPIEKDEGCNHMCCRKCRKEFCWICMQDWSLHSDNTGGYFQCNRFVDNGAGNSEQISGEGFDVWAEERGNAHAETQRIRERGRRMSRFIHYYTRYQAHGDSNRMECKMQTETIRRIMHGLLSSTTASSRRQNKASVSLDTSLIWLQGNAVQIPLDESDLPMPSSQDSTNTSTHEIDPPRLSSENKLASILALSVNQYESDLTGSHQDTTKLTPGKKMMDTTTSTPSRTIQEKIDLFKKHRKQQNAVTIHPDGALNNKKEGSGTSTTGNKIHLITNHILQTDDLLGFLQDGFDELHKCRHFLKWSYPYAYFEFDDPEELEIMQFGFRVPRKNTMHRIRMEDHRLGFETLQSDLELLVETLSDVVARRRLRATHSQIALATRAARSKRIEFESLVIAFSMVKTTESAEPSRSSNSTSLSRQRQASNNSFGEAMRAARNRRRQTSSLETPGRRTSTSSSRPVRLIDRQRRSVTPPSQQSDGFDSPSSRTAQALAFALEMSDEYEFDGGEDIIAHLLHEFEEESKRKEEGSNAASTDQLTMNNDNATVESDDDRLASLMKDENHPLFSNADSLQLLRRRMEEIFNQSLSSPNSSNPLNVSSVGNATENNHSLTESSGQGVVQDATSDEVNVTPVQSRRSSTSHSQTSSHVRRSRANRNSNDESLPRITPLQLYAEEETDLNHAILLSLQASKPSSAVPSVVNPIQPTVAVSVVSDEDEIIKTTTILESDIESLMSMGFNRDQSIQALRESDSNVELAANRLFENS